VSESENNNTLGMADPIGAFNAPGGSVLIDGVLGVNDVDWFTFTLNETSSLTFFAAFGTGDGILQIATNDGGVADVIAFDDNSGLGLMPALQINNLAVGTYYIGFSGVGDVDSNSVQTDELADGLGHQENFGYKLSVGVSIVPAPGSLALLGTGGMLIIRRRRA